MSNRGQGKVERQIKTVNDRLRTNKRVVSDKHKEGLSEISYALRNAPKSNTNSPAELHLGRKLTTVKDILTTEPTTNNYNVSQIDSNFELEISNFPRDQNSEIKVRERALGSKRESTYKRKKGRITEKSHTVTMQETGKAAQKNSKRDIARTKGIGSTTANQNTTPETNQQTAHNQRKTKKFRIQRKRSRGYQRKSTDWQTGENCWNQMNTK